MFKSEIFSLYNTFSLYIIHLTYTTTYVYISGMTEVDLPQNAAVITKNIEQNLETS